MKKEKKIFDAITNVPDNLVEEAANTTLRAKQDPARSQTGLFGSKLLNTGWKRTAAVAACAVLICGLAIIFPLKKSMDPSTALLWSVSLPKAYAFDDYDTKREIRNENPIEESFALALNEFSYDTACALLAGKSGNQNYSPLSLYYALAMAASGAKGNTQTELLTLLGMEDSAALAEQCGNLFRRLYHNNKIGALKLANSLWIDDSLDVATDYAKLAAENYYASSFHVDFADNKTADMMADWIKENVNGTIKPQFTRNPEQVLSIMNTVYFYDEWTDRFDKSKTEEDIFYLADGTTTTCDFMNSVYVSAGFSKGEGFTRSSLGLKNSGNMTFILPDEGVTPNDLLSSPERLKEAFEGGTYASGRVTWQVPKFSFASSYNCSEALKDLGIVSAFTQNADFTGITDGTAFISNVKQETHIGINEKGVEASAFTKIDYAGAAMPTDQADMILNRPFLYGITSSTGDLLFIGICAVPTQN